MRELTLNRSTTQGIPRDEWGWWEMLAGWAEILNQVGVGDRKLKCDFYVNRTFLVATGWSLGTFWQYIEEILLISTSKENT